MRIISITNQKGGCGKTTTAINLSSALALAGRRTLIIDLDPQAHASFGLGITSQQADKSIYNVLTENDEKRRPLESCIVNVSKKLDIVPSSILLSTLEQELKDKEDAVSKLHNVLVGANLPYDYVIIDCPPSLGFLTFNALRAAALIIVPIDMSAFSLMGVGKLLGMLELINLKIGHVPRVKALATLFDKRTKYSQTMFDEIKMFFRDQMLDSVIRMNVALKKAVPAGVSVMQFEPYSTGASDYGALAQEVLRIEGDSEFEKAMAEVSAETQAPAPIPSVPSVPSVPAAPAISTGEATFAIDAPGANEVYVVGDFNNWQVGSDGRLSKSESGRWEKRLGLSSGKYSYKFVVDGQWILDTNNAEKEQNSFGTFNSVLKV
ncbi:MAG: AAA family ATPase [Candidatus Omnitrophica bacterium]|nr:AAA family ATPase [Candidatus Omnitrophota bacterium]